MFLSSAVTRGLVVSTRDPLFSGRVKVWIPVIHGNPKQDADSSDIGEDTAPLSSSTGIINLQEINEEGKWVNPDYLPWATVLGHNWAPPGHLLTGSALNQVGRPSGVMCVPSVGTEVFIVFEDDNPNYPIILGSVFHKDEFTSLSSVTELEMFPGISINSSSTMLTADEYESQVSNSFVVRSNNESSLIISDIVGREQIILGGSIKWSTVGTEFINNPGSLYHSFAMSYPNFPTTASSPFAHREALTKITVVPTVTSATTTTSTTPGPVTTTIIPSTKHLPIPSYSGSPTGGQKLFATRAGGRLHVGIDLGTPAVNLIAPHDGYAMSYTEHPTGTGGNFLLFKGTDGYLHRFVHLTGITAETKACITSKKLITVGTVIGTTGNTGIVNGKPYPYHLHWECLPLSVLVNGSQKPFGHLITTGELATAVISAAYVRGAGGSVTLPGMQVTLTNYSFVDPLKSWLYNGEGTVISNSIPPDLGTTIDESSASSNKIMGLEVCLTPGKEHIYLRHSSGSFLGFDADGNFKLFTVGDVQIRANRSMVLDIFGSITTSCLAAFTRIKTLCRMHTGSSIVGGTNSHKFTAGVDKSITAESALYNKFPSALFEIDVSRYADMQDALIASKSNFYVTSSLGTKSLPELQADESRIILLEEEKTEVANTSDYDKLIDASFTKYMTGSEAEKNEYIKQCKQSIYFNTKLFKAIMLEESGGYSGTKFTSYGLFQLKIYQIQEVSGRKKLFNDSTGKLEDQLPLTWNFDGSNIETYSADNFKNIDTAIQYFNICLREVYGTARNTYRKLDSTAGGSAFTLAQHNSLIKIATLAFHVGYTKIIPSFEIALTNSGIGGLSYILVEDILLTNKLFTREQLLYVPRIFNWIFPHLP